MDFSKRSVDYVFAAAGIALAVASWYLSSSFPRPHVSQLGAAVFPRLVGTLLGCAAVAIAVQSFLRRDGDGIHIGNPWRVAAAFLATLAYTLALGSAGFLLATPVYLVILLMLAGCLRPVVLASVGIGVTVLVYVMFKVLLESPLPSGPLPL